MNGMNVIIIYTMYVGCVMGLYVHNDSLRSLVFNINPLMAREK